MKIRELVHEWCNSGDLKETIRAYISGTKRHRPKTHTAPPVTPQPQSSAPTVRKTE